MKDDNSGEPTRKAERKEEERRKRISEKQKLYNVNLYYYQLELRLRG
jgi:hypothetical protein